jgi:hypothetical protein
VHLTSPAVPTSVASSKHAWRAVSRKWPANGPPRLKVHIRVQPRICSALWRRPSADSIK